VFLRYFRKVMDGMLYISSGWSAAVPVVCVCVGLDDGGGCRIVWKERRNE